MVADAPAYAWSNAQSPGGGPVQGIGGSTAVLVASTWWNGAYRSFDSGRHWEPIADFPPVEEARVAFDPSDPDVGYVYGFGGVARTLDGGDTWSHALDTPVTYRLAVGPGGVVIASARDDAWYTHILLSNDRGATWTDVDFPMTSSTRFMSLYGLAFGHTQADVVAMSISRMYRTTDGGATWTESSHDFLDLQRAPDGTLWGGGFTLATSVDDGATWQSVAAPATGHPLGMGPDGRVFVPTDEGVLVTSDGGASWTDLGHGDAVWGATQLLVDPTDPSAVFVADEFIGVARVSPAGYEGRSTGLQPVAISALAGSADGSILLAGGENGIYASRDEGATWAHTGAGMGFMGIRAVAASDDGRVLMGGGSTRVFWPFLVSSRDGGATWTFSGPDLGGDGWITGIAIDPEDPLHAFAAASMDIANSKLIETTNGGLSWRIALEIPVLKIRDVAWDRAAGKPIVATEAGVLAYEGNGLVTPRGATLNTWTVAAQGGRSWSNGPELSLWSGEQSAPHAPWAHTGAYVVDLAPESSAIVWAANEGGALARCEALACVDVSAPAQSAAVLVTEGAVYAGTPDGIYRADR